MRFTKFDLKDSLQEAVARMGYEETTPVQAATIPLGLEQRDITGCAPTGTGKTLAFLLPALQRLLENPAKTKKKPRILVLEPTRELAIQVEREARKLTASTSLRSVAVYGGAGMRKQTDRLRKGVDIVVATPGRLMDHMRRRNVDLRSVEVLVLDEADRMLDMGFVPDIIWIVERLPRERQTMLFSATIPPAIASLALRFQRDPESVVLDRDRPPESIEQVLYPVPKHLKTDLLLAILGQMEVDSMLVFTQTKQAADVLARQLGEAGLAAACLHGDFSQKERLAALEGFRSGKHRVLVATNVAARGLDVEGISHVVNYDVPEQPEDYIHRIGRTARADAAGMAISLVTLDEERLIFRIEHVLGRKIERRRLEGFNYDVPTPSWARPSAQALMERRTRSQSLADRWRSML
jgi:ATP-dependent RNA helicase RhlE